MLQKIPNSDNCYIFEIFIHLSILKKKYHTKKYEYKKILSSTIIY